MNDQHELFCCRYVVNADDRVEIVDSTVSQNKANLVTKMRSLREILPCFTHELHQLSANKRYWAKRLTELRDELKTEPERIRNVYSVMAKRVEPVGLVYLWPVTG